ncbi:unnamed protein product, partial [Lymnaea stagnalis]
TGQPSVIVPNLGSNFDSSCPSLEAGNDEDIRREGNNSKKQSLSPDSKVISVQEKPIPDSSREEDVVDSHHKVFRGTTLEHSSSMATDRSLHERFAQTADLSLHDPLRDIHLSADVEMQPMEVSDAHNLNLPVGQGRQRTPVTD